MQQNFGSPFSVYSIVTGRVWGQLNLPLKMATGGIIKKCGMIKRFNSAEKLSANFHFGIDILNLKWYNTARKLKEVPFYE